MRGIAPPPHLPLPKGWPRRVRSAVVQVISLARTSPRRWRQILPEGFQMAVKVPQAITHEKRLQDCQDELMKFLGAMDKLEDRLGPLLFQSPYFSKASGMTFEGFQNRLRAFLRNLPEG